MADSNLMKAPAFTAGKPTEGDPRQPAGFQPGQERLIGVWH